MALVIMVMLMCFQASAGALAQSGSQVLKSATSLGLIADVVGISYAQNHFLAQIIIKNNTNVGVYLEDASYDGSQTAFLGSGESLPNPTADGLPACGNDYAGCISNPTSITIDKFSYIDPGSSVGVALDYVGGQAPSNPDTITFGVALIARFAKSAEDSSPNDAGPVQKVSFSFPFVSFSSGN